METNITNETGQDLYYKKAVDEKIDDQLPTQTDNFIHAINIRKVLKDIIATIWKKEHTLTTDETHNEIYWMDKQNQSSRKAENSITWVDIPKCDTLIIPEDLINKNSNPLARIEMKNVQNGHILNLICKCKLQGLQNVSVNTDPGILNWGSYNGSVTIITRDKSNTEGNYYLDDEYTQKVNNLSNLGWPAMYSDYNKVTPYRWMYTYPLQLIFWNDYWYPVNIY